MPKITTKVVVTNSGNASVSARVGASLVGASDHVKYFNTSDDVKDIFPIGKATIARYLSNDLGVYQNCYLYVVL